jgi:hypothetical protein
MEIFDVAAPKGVAPVEDSPTTGAGDEGLVE